MANSEGCADKENNFLVGYGPCSGNFLAFFWHYLIAMALLDNFGLLLCTTMHTGGVDVVWFCV